MTIEAITAAGLSSITHVLPAQAGHPASSDFSTVLDQVSSLSEQIKSNDVATQNLAMGQVGNLHEVMMSMESARLQLDLLLQVRNKVLDSYQQMMNMQV